MITLVGAILGGVGLMCVLYRRTLLGTLIGIQILMMGASLEFVITGLQGKFQEGQSTGVFIVLSAVMQLVAGLALVTRLFYVKKRAELNDIRSLKH